MKRNTVLAQALLIIVFLSSCSKNDAPSSPYQFESVTLSETISEVSDETPSEEPPAPSEAVSFTPSVAESIVISSNVISSKANPPASTQIPVPGRAFGGNSDILCRENSHLFAIMDGWIFYTSYYGINRIRPDGGEKELIYAPDSGLCTGMKAADGRIFFLEGSGYKLCSIDIHGGDFRVLYEYGGGSYVLADTFTLDNGWIYYQNIESNCMLWKMRTDGSDKACLDFNSNTARNICVQGDWVYYIAGYNVILRVKTDGTSQQTIMSQDNAGTFCVDGEIIFYSTHNGDYEGKELYRICADGSNRKKLANARIVGNLVAKNGWVYYANYSDTANKETWFSCGKIYKVDVNGKNLSKVSNDESTFLEISGDGLYYSNEMNENKFTALRLQ